ncbi:MAG: hypothetical protein HY332_16130, partial [Chloroflexi bacterium]|nr:hypothetical protein [Chloroflexota bacterium]
MAQIYTRAAARCREHPHRDTKERCSRCHQPFCADCLTPGPRAADGTRGWYCAPCAKLLAEAAAAEAHARTLRGRVERLQTAGSLLLPSLGATAVLVIVAAIWLLALRPQPERQTTCGELTRIRSVGAVGIVAPEEVVNAFAYPARANVKLMAPSGQPGQAGQPAQADQPGQSGQPAQSAASAAPAAANGADASGSASDP